VVPNIVEEGVVNPVVKYEENSPCEEVMVVDYFDPHIVAITNGASAVNLESLYYSGSDLS
jgi:hypothetical protein